MFTDIFLPKSLKLAVDQFIVKNETIILEISSHQSAGQCPDCGQVSRRVHSHYRRTVADLPCVGWAMYLSLQVHRFFCDNSACKHKTFTERLPGLVAPSARRTIRLADQQRQLGLDLGGKAGARLASHLAMTTSDDTILRLLPGSSQETVEAPRVLGVDDWAWSKGTRYGTILVDLENHRPIDLLPDRSAETLTAWLQEHPGVEIISRDRAPAYIEGASQGAPDAIQVADRWHLLSNLKEVLQRLLDRYQACLYAAATEPEPEKQPEPEPTPVSEEKDPEPQLAKAEQRRQATRQRRLARYQTVIELHQQGKSMRAIARELKLGNRTVRRYIRAGEFPEMAQRRQRATILDPYLTYLEERWSMGFRNAAQLYREIKAQGYPGSQPLVGLWAWKKRQQEPQAVQTKKTTPKPASRSRPWSTGYAVWCLMKQPNQLTADKKAALDRMLQASAEVQRAYHFGQAFIRIIHNRFSKALDPWLETLRDSDIAELRGFARSLLKDRDAVLAALTLPWSNGQVEGQINRLKLIKRQMYGRAGFELLRLRVLAT